MLICVAAAAFHEDFLEITAGCIMCAASLLLISELIMLLLHFLNPSHFNNNYTAYCRWVSTIIFSLYVTVCHVGYCQMYCGCYWPVHYVLL